MIEMPENIARVQVFWSAPDDAVFTAKTTADVLELSEQTLSNWRVSGTGPLFIKAGRLLYYRKADVMAWLKRLGDPIASTSQLRGE